MNIIKTLFYNNKSQKISAKIYKNPNTTDGVIFSHGLFSTKDGYKITRLAEGIVNAGYTLLTFDFSFVGESEGNISELSILQEVDDLNSAYLFFKKSGIDKVHLVGSSMGGLVTLLFSSVMGNKISSQTLIAAPVLLDEIILKMSGVTDIGVLSKNGYTEVDGISIHNHFFKEAKTIDMPKAILENKVHALIIHGGNDTVVPVNNAAALMKNLTCEKRMILIEDGDHNLSRDSDIKILSDNILEWLNAH